MRVFCLVLLIPFAAAACATSAARTHQAEAKGRSKRQALAMDARAQDQARAKAKLSDDYTLTGRKVGFGDTNFFLESPTDDATTELPDFVFTPRAADSGDEVAEQMFPTSPGSIEDALGEVRGPEVRIFTVVVESESVRAGPTEDSALVRPLAKGERVLGFVDGAFARIGYGEFVPLESLASTPNPDAGSRASLPWSDMGR
jgi:hypothetical protein